MSLHGSEKTQGIVLSTFGRSSSDHDCSLYSINQPLTSWAQRQKLRAEKTKVAQPSSQNSEYKEQPCSLRESPKQTFPQWPDSQEQVGLPVIPH